MCKSRGLLCATLLFWPWGALCAQEKNKEGGGVSAPEAAAPQASDRQSPLPRVRQGIGERRDESKPAEESNKSPDEPKLPTRATLREEGQPAAREIPDDLGDALSLALGHNPLLLVAEAKRREAEAEYDQVSLSVVHDVTLAFRQLAHEKKSLESHECGGAVPASQLREERENVARAKAKLHYLLGIDTRPEVTDRKLTFDLKERKTYVKVGAAHQPGAPPSDAGGLVVSAELRAALQSKIDLDFSEQPLSDVLDYLQEISGRIQFLKKWKGEDFDVPVTASLKGVTLQAALQALSDLTQTSFVFRDYGILVIHHPNEAMIYRDSNAPMIAPAFLGEQPAGEPRRENKARP